MSSSGTPSEFNDETHPTMRRYRSHLSQVFLGPGGGSKIFNPRYDWNYDQPRRVEKYDPPIMSTKDGSLQFELSKVNFRNNEWMRHSHLMGHSLSHMNITQDEINETRWDGSQPERGKVELVNHIPRTDGSLQEQLAAAWLLQRATEVYVRPPRPEAKKKIEYVLPPSARPRSPSPARARSPGRSRSPEGWGSVNRSHARRPVSPVRARSPNASPRRQTSADVFSSSPPRQRPRSAHQGRNASPKRPSLDYAPTLEAGAQSPPSPAREDSRELSGRNLFGASSSDAPAPAPGSPSSSRSRKDKAAETAPVVIANVYERRNSQRELRRQESMRATTPATSGDARGRSPARSNKSEGSRDRGASRERPRPTSPGRGRSPGRSR